MRMAATKEIATLILRVRTVTYRGNTDTKYLSDCGVSSEYAETGHHALELTGHCDYDLIVADLNTDNMLGNDMIRRAQAAGSATPTIILAGSASAEVIVKALNDGANDFIRWIDHPPTNPDFARLTSHSSH